MLSTEMEEASGEATWMMVFTSGRLMVRDSPPSTGYDLHPISRTISGRRNALPSLIWRPSTNWKNIYKNLDFILKSLVKREASPFSLSFDKACNNCLQGNIVIHVTLHLAIVYEWFDPLNILGDNIECDCWVNPTWSVAKCVVEYSFASYVNISIASVSVNVGVQQAPIGHDISCDIVWNWPNSTWRFINTPRTLLRCPCHTLRGLTLYRAYFVYLWSLNEGIGVMHHCHNFLSYNWGGMKYTIIGGGWCEGREIIIWRHKLGGWGWVGHSEEQHYEVIVSWHGCYAHCFTWLGFPRNAGCCRKGPFGIHHIGADGWITQWLFQMECM